MVNSQHAVPRPNPLDKVEADLLEFAIENNRVGKVNVLVLLEECSEENFRKLRDVGFTQTFPFPIGEVVGGYTSMKNLEGLNDLLCVRSIDLMRDRIVRI